MTDDARDLQAITQIQQQIWSQGDFSKIGTAAQIVQEELCEAVDILPGQRALDVACGAGNGAIAAARRRAQAVGVDYVPELLERGRERAPPPRDMRSSSSRAMPRHFHSRMAHSTS